MYTTGLSINEIAKKYKRFIFRTEPSFKQNYNNDETEKHGVYQHEP